MNKEIIFHIKAIWRLMSDSKKWAFAAFSMWLFGTIVVFGAVVQTIDPGKLSTLINYLVFFIFMAAINFMMLVASKKE